MKSLKTASMLILAVFMLSMVSGVSAAAECSCMPPEELTVNVNETFNITMMHSPHGYWKYDFDPNYLTLVNETYVPDELIGSGGDKFTFKALKTGNTVIHIEYSDHLIDGHLRIGGDKFYFVNIVN